MFSIGKPPRAARCRGNGSGSGGRRGDRPGGSGDGGSERRTGRGERGRAVEQGRAGLVSGPVLGEHRRRGHQGQARLGDALPGEPGWRAVPPVHLGGEQLAVRLAAPGMVGRRPPGAVHPAESGYGKRDAASTSCSCAPAPSPASRCPRGSRSSATPGPTASTSWRRTGWSGPELQGLPAALQPGRQAAEDAGADHLPVRRRLPARRQRAGGRDATRPRAGQQCGRDAQEPSRARRQVRLQRRPVVERDHDPRDLRGAQRGRSRGSGWSPPTAPGRPR